MKKSYFDHFSGLQYTTEDIIKGNDPTFLNQIAKVLRIHYHEFCNWQHDES